MKIRASLILLLPVMLAGCTWLAPSYERPAFDVPDQLANASDAEAKVESDWVKTYRDPVLEKLVTEALASNDDLAVAGAKLQQAKANYDYAFANRFPLLAATGYASRSKTDFEPSPLLSDKPSNFGFFGGMLSYEIDLWGKNASMSAAAEAGVKATQNARDAARLSIASATANLYFSLLALDEDAKLVRQMIDVQTQTHALVKKQAEVQAASALDLHQSEAMLAAVRAQLPEIEDQKSKAESALALLLGRSPRALMEGKIERGADLASLPVTPFVPRDLPSALLERRPDIAAREQALIASHFNIGVARAAYFPTLSLSNLLGITSLDLNNLYQGTVRTWSMGGTLMGPVIDFGRTDSGVDLAKAENQEQLALYKQAVRTAFKETRDALVAQNTAREAEDEQATKETAMKETLRLTELKQASGFASALDVNAAKRAFIESQIARTSARLNRLTASVDLFKALGGGWTGE